MEDIHIQSQPQEDDRPPLWKQILGAVIGGGLALAVYYAYDYAKPKLNAYLTLPAAEGGRMYDLGASNIADKTMDEGNRKRILSRNLRAAGQLEDNAMNDPSLLETVDNHELDIAWPGHDENNPKYAEVIADTNVQPGPDIAGEYADKWPKPEGSMQANLMQEEMATMEMGSNDGAWEDLWGDIREDERSTQHMERANAEDLPDTGFGLGFVVAGALGGSAGTRYRKKFASLLKK